ncbi:flagellar biosynthetic protein FliO [Leifsonia sp. YAF41]|uniref:flagellar biosynthetic protein FliO n=1 Tax=Leifsonia sp. YAF41 TaxID=3233086 RepID=UPI003F9E3903
MDTVFLALRVIVSLAAVLGVIWYAHKRLTKSSRAAQVANPIRVVSRQGLSPKSSVVIIEAEGKRFVLGVTEQSVNVLYERDSDPMVTLQPAENFALALASASDKEPLGAAPLGAAPLDAAPLDSPPSGADLLGADGQPGRRRDLIRTPATQGMLRGSILSAETWKLSFAALRQGLK